MEGRLLESNGPKLARMNVGNYNIGEIIEDMAG